MSHKRLAHPKKNEREKRGHCLKKDFAVEKELKTSHAKGCVSKWIICNLWNHRKGIIITKDRVNHSEGRKSGSAAAVLITEYNILCFSLFGSQRTADAPSSSTIFPYGRSRELWRGQIRDLADTRKTCCVRRAINNQSTWILSSNKEKG